MKTIKRIFNYTVSIVIICAILNAVKPYWEKFWLETHLENAAVYATKNSTDETIKMLLKKTSEEGFDFTEEDFVIRKAPDNSVSIHVSYGDSISFFGWTLKELDFVAEARALEATGY